MRQLLSKLRERKWRGVTNIHGTSIIKHSYKVSLYPGGEGGGGGGGPYMKDWYCIKIILEDIIGPFTMLTAILAYLVSPSYVDVLYYSLAVEEPAAPSGTGLQMEEN